MKEIKPQKVAFKEMLGTVEEKKDKEQREHLNIFV